MQELREDRTIRETEKMFLDMIKIGDCSRALPGPGCGFGIAEGYITSG